MRKPPPAAPPCGTALHFNSRSPLDRFLHCLATAEALEGISSQPLHALRQRLQANGFNLVVVGEFKRGKSSVLNALIGADVLPVGVIPLTAITTILEYGETPQVVIAFQNGDEEVVAQEALWDYATEKGNPGNTRGVAEVHIA